MCEHKLHNRQNGLFTSTQRESHYRRTIKPPRTGLHWSSSSLPTLKRKKASALCVFQRLMGPDGMSMVNGTTGVHGEEYWTDGGNMSQVRPSSPQAQAQGQSQAQPQRQVSDVYSNTLPVRRPAPAKNKSPVGKRPERDPAPRALNGFLVHFFWRCSALWALLVSICSALELSWTLPVGQSVCCISLLVFLTVFQ